MAAEAAAWLRWNQIPTLMVLTAREARRDRWSLLPAGAMWKGTSIWPKRWPLTITFEVKTLSSGEQTTSRITDNLA